MRYKALTSTGLRVSQLCLGTMVFGGQTPEAESIRIVEEAVAGGINFIDTANIYPDAGGQTGGASEIAIGKALKGKRDDVILATKVRVATNRGINNRGLTRRHILQAVEQSLKRLQTDYIDLYYMHLPDDETPIGESLRAMEDLIRSGKVHYVGLSNFASWQVAVAMAEAACQNLSAPILSENVYNLLTRSIEPELVPCARHHRMGLAVYNPLCGGLLTGKHRMERVTDQTRFSDDDLYLRRYWNEDNFRAVQELEQVADQAGITLVELAVRWCASHPFVDTVIIGASRLEQIRHNLKLLDAGALTQDVMDACDRVWDRLSGTRFRYTAQKVD